MLLGKIDYLNLLPFHVFLKSLPLPSYVKKSIEFKKGVPSKLCADLYNCRIDNFQHRKPPRKIPQAAFGNRRKARGFKRTRAQKLGAQARSRVDELKYASSRAGS